MPARSTPPPARSARRALAGLLLIPLLSLAALWGFSASLALANVIRDRHYNDVSSTLDAPCAEFQEELAAERTLTVLWLDTHEQSQQLRGQLLAARHSTDTAVVAVRHAVTSVDGLVSAPASLQGFLAELAELPRIRAAVDAGTQTVAAAFRSYSAVDNAEFAFFHTASPSSDPELTLMTQAVIAGNRSEDLANGGISLVDGSLSADGRMAEDERALLAEILGQQELEAGDALAMASPALESVYQEVFGSPAYQQLVATETQIASAPPGQPVGMNPAVFRAAVAEFQKSAQSTLLPINALLAARSAGLSDSLLTQLFVAGGLGLAAVVLSVFVAFRFGRRLRAELTQLYVSARDMAEERLPRLVERLGRGEEVNVEAESPPLRDGRIAEIASVAQAFSSVQRTAVEAAVGQARLRKGVSQVFVSLSLRSQSLLHKQLSLLDEMERATSDPDSLADLFRLDHLTTRMRRHAEGLLILAGRTPGRGWRDPVLVADVLNAAVAEVEDYTRVDVITDSAHAVTGTAVSDVIHLLAELIENATAFSPPHTRVEIRGGSVGNGFALEIEDRGLGMADAELGWVNSRLASPPEFDLADADQLGLFITARLAARHGIRVLLRQSPFGGTLAIVMFPHPVVVPANEAFPANEVLMPNEAFPANQAFPARAAGGPSMLTVAADAGPGQHAPYPHRMTGRHRLDPPPPAADIFAARDDRPPWAVPPQPLLDADDGPAREQREQTVQPQPQPRADSSLPARDGRRALPRRARQQSLAPQLRDRLSSGPAGRQEDPAPPARSPEEAGGLLAALQGGWQRGRVDDLPEPSPGQDGWWARALAVESYPEQSEDLP